MKLFQLCLAIALVLGTHTAFATDQKKQCGCTNCLCTPGSDCGCLSGDGCHCNGGECAIPKPNGEQPQSNNKHEHQEK